MSLASDPVAISRVVILGAGHAGGSVAAFLRQYGFAGSVTLIGREPLAPYQRPPLSKAWLKGQVDAESLALRPHGWYASAGVDLRLDATATAIDRERRRVWLTSGESLAYDALILATGARARTLALPGSDLAGVGVLRDVDDAQALKTAIGPGRRLAVIGAGYVGLEAAASARGLGAEVVVVERESRVLARVASRALSSAFEARHRQEGVSLELGAGLARIEGAQGHVTAVALMDGRSLACDGVLVGVGAAPNDDLARACGVDCEDGVLVDQCARTSDRRIFAIGDVARRRPAGDVHSLRLESVQNALEQAKQAACAITGRLSPDVETPWFWSDQYDLKLQIAGVPQGDDRLVTRGDPARARFAIFHLRENTVTAVEAVNAPAEFMGGRQLIARRTPIDPERLVDLTLSMKEVAA